MPSKGQAVITTKRLENILGGMFPGPRNLVLFLVNSQLDLKKKKVNRLPCQVFMLLYLARIRQV